MRVCVHARTHARARLHGLKDTRLGRGKLHGPRLGTESIVWNPQDGLARSLQGYQPSAVQVTLDSPRMCCGGGCANGSGVNGTPSGHRRRRHWVNARRCHHPCPESLRNRNNEVGPRRKHTQQLSAMHPQLQQAQLPARTYAPTHTRTSTRARAHTLTDRATMLG